MPIERFTGPNRLNLHGSCSNRLIIENLEPGVSVLLRIQSDLYQFRSRTGVNPKTNLRARPQAVRETRQLSSEGAELSDKIWIAFGCDSCFAPHVGATIASIVRRTPAQKLHFLIMHNGISETQREMTQTVAAAAEFTWIDMADFELPEYKVSNHISRATLFRLGLEKLAPEACQRLIYLDADLIVMDDLQDLWDFDLKGAAIGAVPDAYLSSGIDDVHQHWRAWISEADAQYLNAGVMLIDMEQVRQTQSFSKALEKIALHGADLPYQDQDAINWIHHNNWIQIPTEWNVQRVHLLEIFEQHFSQESMDATQRPKIVHFTGPEKPWTFEGYHPWWWAYWDALAGTPFFGIARKSLGVSRAKLLHIWLRWLRKRPLSKLGIGNLPSALWKS